MNDRPSPNVFWVTVLFELGAGVLALLIGWWRRETPWDFIGWNARGALLGVAAAAPPLILLLLIRRFPVGPLRGLKELADSLVGGFFTGCTYWHMAAISLAAGFGEELLFRGVIQHVLELRFGGMQGLLLASLIFGLAHPMSRAYFVLATLLGAYLGGLWIYADYNLLAPILAHALYDFGALLVMLRIKPASGE